MKNPGLELADLSPPPAQGRRFERTRPVRLGDVDASGHLRLDATARYAQDVANDDSIDGGLDEAASMAWVVRKTTIERDRAATLREQLTLTTWCSGVGSRWAERRTSMRGDRGARVDVATIWVHVDPDSGAPTRLPPEFDALYAHAAGGRKVSARLTHTTKPPPNSTRHPWHLRVVDLDVLGHVNNAAALAILEEFGLPMLHSGQPVRTEIEYRTGLPGLGAASVTRATTGDGESVDLWIHAGGELCVTITATGRRSSR